MSELRVAIAGGRLDRDHVDIAPPDALSKPDGRVGYAGFSRPLRCGQALAKGFDVDAVAPISALFRDGRPPAVPRLVVAVAVDAVDRVRRRRPWTHVREERFKVIRPSLAHGDAAPAIQRVRVLAGVCAATAHRIPRVVLGRGPGYGLVSVSVVAMVSASSAIGPAATLSHRRLLLRVDGHAARLLPTTRAALQISTFSRPFTTERQWNA